MSIVDSLIRELGKNHSNLFSIIQHRLERYIRRAGNYIQGLPNKDDKVAVEEAVAISVTSKVGGMSIIDDLNETESEVTARQATGSCNDKSALENSRSNYDKAIELIRNIKTPYYTSNEEKRFPGKINWSTAGNEDPFYDEINKLYPNGGLKQFRDENINLVKGLQKATEGDINLASKKYNRVQNAISKVRYLFEIPILYGAFLIYPNSFAELIDPFTFGLGVAVVTAGILAIPSNLRNYNNEKIFEARLRIGKDLGIKYKDIKWSPQDIHDFDYDDSK